jgi:molybdate transport system substrate-binding protein
VIAASARPVRQESFMRQTFRSLVGAAALLCSCAQAAEVQVAVAANFAVPLAKVSAAFSAATGHTLKIAAGATGKFYSQIVAGAPFEVLIAADAETPKKLVSEGHAVAGSDFTYAIGKLVLWSAKPDFVDSQGAVLGSGRFAHLAIANPKAAPYGAAALQVIQARGLTEALAPKLVTGQSIAQAFQFVGTGNAELGFVALSQVIAAGPAQGDQRALGGPESKAPGGPAFLPGKAGPGSYWLVPQALYGEIRQDAVLLQRGAGNPAAKALLAYLKSPAAQQVIRSFGYGIDP